MTIKELSDNSLFQIILKQLPHSVTLNLPIEKFYSACRPLIIHGISSDNPKINCRVFADWNDLKPMQNVTAKGPGGANDYSNWTYTYNGSYHNITTGINELTSKITCYAYDLGNITKSTIVSTLLVVEDLLTAILL